MTLPNVITMARLASVPVVVWLVWSSRYSAGFWVILAATLSDALDGFLARRWSMESRLGALLDPIADKALLIAVFVTLGYQGYVETWLVILIVSRDILIVGGAIALRILTGDLHVKPAVVSKLNTAAQMILAVLFVAQLAFGMALPAALTLFTWLAVATTVVSGVVYSVLWARQIGDAHQLKAGRL